MRKQHLFILVILAISFMFGGVSSAGTSDVKLTKLDNGLTVITKEIHTAPVVSLSVWYKVGSRNESTGITGISHLLEHMAFKGSEKYPTEGSADRVVRSIGGSGNAGTNTDYTVYYETVPAGKENVIIDIEADRMNGLLLRAEDLDSERNVVAEERKMRNEDNPTGLFWEEVNATAFKVHPYGWPIIGWMSDIMGITREDVEKYYKSHYAPNNAILVLTGDFDTNKVLEQITSAFGSIPKGSEPPRMNAAEPKQDAEKTVLIRSDKTNLADVVYAYHAPSITGSDSPALEVIASILSSGRESRLYKDLVDSGIASSAEATHDTNTDAYLFYIEVEVQPGNNPDDVRKKLDEEIEKLKTETVSDYELQKAKNRFAADEIFSNESISSIGRKLGWFQLTAGDYGYLDKYMDMISKVTAEDVKNAADKYFIDTNRTVGILLPKSGDSQQSSGAHQISPISAHADYGITIPKIAEPKKDNKDINRQSDSKNTIGKIEFSSRIKKKVLPNGLTVILYENHSFPSIHIRGVIRGAGAFSDPKGKNGLAQLVARAIQRGTKTRTYEDINKALEFVGAEMSISSGNETVVFSGKYLKKDFAIGMDILSDVLMNPVFPEEGVAAERDLLMSDLINIMKSNNQQAWLAFTSLIYRDHPYGNPVLGTDAGVKSITTDDLNNFHKSFYRPDRTILIIAGDATLEEASSVAEKYFGMWKRPNKDKFVVPPVPELKKAETKYVYMPEKMQDVFYIGFPTLRPNNPDIYTFEMATDIMAGTDLTSRLYKSIREDEGLVYYVYGNHLPRTAAATFQIVGGLAPENLDRAVELVRKEIKRMQTEPISDEELNDAKNFAIGQLPLQLETNEGAAAIISDLEYFGRPFDVIDNYPAIILKITSDAIMKVSKEWMSADIFALGVAGPSQAPSQGEQK